MKQLLTALAFIAAALATIPAVATKILNRELV